MRFKDLLKEDDIYDQMVNELMNLVVVYQSNSESEVPIDTLLRSLHDLNYDANKEFVIDTLKSKPFIKNISDDTVYFETENDNDDSEEQDFDKKQDHIADMAQRAIKKNK